MLITLPDPDLVAALHARLEAAALGLTLAVWDWNEPVRTVLGAAADDVVCTVLPYFRPAPQWRTLTDLPNLRLVQAQSAGYDNLLHILPAGVALANARGVHDASTAELALALILAAQRDLPRLARARSWQPAPTRALADSRVLLVGVGAIGEAIRRRLAPFEVNLTRVGRRARSDEHGPIHAVSELPQLLPHADIVVLIVPLTTQTRGLLGAAELALLPDDALVVNVARGPVVDTAALTAQVLEGRLRLAADVFDPEPLPADHPLWQADGALLTPHIGGHSAAMRPRIVALLAAQLQRLAAGARPLNIVA
ncbi:NAD(P)-dependent oxidoreductase [Buchananella hordeovulneris]|uniref:NAD(P)-dependent oxidoreductase n=1 Tax=Buchananella hordeovulneris TaxID=52770 RepID=UPI0026DD4DB5|nr:NAD(P)-dependent oxidoreductase [Buchananella hordeovulneris]MDO5081372.1 NAD(P)-dependent oxidoreductase [Buchananella hordeovulneris]